MRVCGIDPGVSGALGLIDGRIFIDVGDMPTILRGTSKTKHEVNAASVTQMLREWKPELVIIERVQASPTYGKAANQRQGMGVVAAFNFGDSFGQVKGVVAALGLEMRLISPQKWKRAAALIGQSKEVSRAHAQRIWPAAPLDRKKDAGRAEALLIALYGLEERDAELSRRNRNHGANPEHPF